MTLVRDESRQNAHLTFKANVGLGRHGWLRLTPAYSMRLVRAKVAGLPGGSVVTDPFSGTGTTPLAAAEHGLLGQSQDINPFLIWLGRTKTARFEEDVTAEVGRLAAEVVAAARRVLPNRDLWQPNLFRIERWWDEGALQALKALRHALAAVDTAQGAKDLLAIAFCRALIGCSNASFGHQSMSLKSAAPQPRHAATKNKEDAERVLLSFESEALQVAASAHPDLPGSARITHSDSRNPFQGLEPCDLLLTSPPYVNRMSYIRELRPYMYWLGYLDVAAGAGELDWKAIGGTWGVATSKLNGWRPSETGTPVDAQMDEVRARIARDGGRNGPLLSNYVGKYFHDMWEHFVSARDHVKPGGSVSYIIGNSTFYGHLVPAEQWYAAMLRHLGFERVEVETIRKRNSNGRLFEFDVRGVRP